MSVIDHTLQVFSKRCPQQRAICHYLWLEERTVTEALAAGAPAVHFHTATPNCATDEGPPSPMQVKLCFPLLEPVVVFACVGFVFPSAVPRALMCGRRNTLL